MPFETASADVIVSSSCFEHSEMFWVLFLEILRILKPSGLFYLNVPSNGAFHRYPVDCWRFYPDSGNALVKWARLNGLRPTILESYTSNHEIENWRDYVCVFVNDEANAARYPKRIVQTFTGFTNGLAYPDLTNFLNFTYFPEGEGEPPNKQRKSAKRWSWFRSDSRR
jgi:SAM-dependent methyltransferase